MADQHNFTRRALLTGGAAAAISSAALAGAITPALSPSPASTLSDIALPGYASETPEIVSALVKLSKARTALAKVEADVDWFGAQWGYHWPQAPQEILGLRCSEHDDRVETNILGAPVFHVAADLTKRMPRDMRDNRKLCFAIETPAEIREWITTHQTFPLRGRSPETRAKDAQRKARYIAGLERKLALSEAYFAERARVLEASGAAAMLKSRSDARRAVADGFEAVALTPVNSTWGLRAKALAYLVNANGSHDSFKVFGGPFYAGYLLALNTATATRPADGNEWTLIDAAFPDAPAVIEQRA